jgi:hypothetical protein
LEESPGVTGLKKMSNCEPNRSPPDLSADCKTDGSIWEALKMADLRGPSFFLA